MLSDKKGFTLIELIVVIVIIGILAAIAIPRFMGAQNRARIGACEADVTTMRQACALNEIDYASYKIKGTTGSYSDATGYGNFKAALKGYMILPDTTNFIPASFSYSGTDTTFTIKVCARSTGKDTVIGTPDRTYH